MFNGSEDEISKIIHQKDLNSEKIIEKINTTFKKTLDLNVRSLLPRIFLPIPINFLLIIIAITTIAFYGIPLINDIINPDDPVENQLPELSIDPDPLSFNFGSMNEGDTDSRAFFLSNTGSGILEWSITGNQPWVEVSPNSGTDSGTVTVTVNTADMEPGDYSGTLIIESNSGTKTGIIYLNIEQEIENPPQLLLDPPLFPYNFGTMKIDESDSFSFDILNTGGGILQWSVSTNEPWIGIEPANGIDSGTVTVSVNTGNLEASEYSGNILIESNGGNEIGNIRLEVDRLQFIEYDVSKEENLIVKNGLCENGEKNCETVDKIFGGRYYGMVGDHVALNGNPNKLTKIIYSQDIHDQLVLEEGGYFDLSEGIELQVLEIMVDEETVYFSLVKDGLVIDYSEVRQGEVYTYTKNNIAGESDVPMIVAYVDNIFSGTENKNFIQLRYLWAISEDYDTIE